MNGREIGEGGKEREKERERERGERMCCSLKNDTYTFLTNMKNPAIIHCSSSCLTQ